MAVLGIELAIRFVVFAIVFFIAVKKSERIRVEPKYAVPLVGLVFAVLNVGLYWGLSTVLNVATLGAFGLMIPFVLNGLFLYGTHRIVSKLRTKFEIDGIVTGLKLAVLLTLVHGLFYVLFDVIGVLDGLA